MSPTQMCPHCSADVPSGRFCATCGRRLPTPPTPDLAIAPAGQRVFETVPGARPAALMEASDAPLNQAADPVMSGNAATQGLPGRPVRGPNAVARAARRLGTARLIGGACVVLAVVVTAAALLAPRWINGPSVAGASSSLATAPSTAPVSTTPTPTPPATPSPTSANLGPATAPPASDPSVLSRLVEVPGGDAVPPFPTSLTNYRLTAPPASDVIRVFQGQGWVMALPNIMTNDCAEGGYWVLRWKVSNPDVRVTITTGLSDAGTFSPVGTSLTGSTGYAFGFTCTIPGFSFASAVNGNQANLTDINVEFELWDYKPKI